VLLSISLWRLFPSSRDFETTSHRGRIDVADTDGRSGIAPGRPILDRAPMTTPHGFRTLDEAKQALRIRALAARRGCDRVAAGEALTERVLRDCAPSRGAVVAGFWPLDGEIDIRPLLAALHAFGHEVVLPETPKRGLPLTFRVWRPGDEMVKERFGTMRPAGEERRPDFLLVPLLAFDRRGGRIGYGAGYYDRTLSLLSPRFALGCAFAAQEVPEVPTGSLDVLLNAVATDREIILCG
jgi:5-formyltetrahydrofolate cyclo-ligase